MKGKYMKNSLVITGGSQGIGLGLLKKFLSMGHPVFTCSRSEEKLLALKQAMPDAPLFTFKADLSKKAEVLAFADWVCSHGHTLDGLINNAGYFLPGQIQNEAEGVMEAQMESNVYSAYHLTRALLPSFLAQGHGHIFNMCSIASIQAFVNGGSYCISKHALLGFNRVLREELKDQGIKVTAILPGATLTPSWDGVDLPVERFIDVEDLCALVYQCFLTKPSAVVEELLIRPQLGDL